VPVAQSDRDEFQRRVDDAVLVLFAVVAEAVSWATTALLEQDHDRAQRVINEDKAIDQRCEELVDLIKERLATGPLPQDELEDLIAVLQIVPELERSADLAEHVAQRALRSIGGLFTPLSRGLIQRMSDVAAEMWRLAGSAYRQRSRDASFQLADADDELDALATSLVNDVVTTGATPQMAVDLALLARFYERLGDHAVNLSRRVETMASPRRLTVPKLSLRRGRANSSTDLGHGRLRRLFHGLARVRFVPTDEGFFTLFREAAGNCQACAEALRKLVESIDDPDSYTEAIRAYERQGDQLTVEVLRRLDVSFVTPFDREDIHALAEELDDVVDHMFAAASLIQLVRDEDPLPELVDLGDTLVAMADELVGLVACLPSGEGARLRLEHIEHLERQGDAVFHRGMARLFGGEYEALAVIKWKDIIQALEDSLNAIEEASEVIEGILVKNS
jgi:uncharacterized protein Yka (UPF0111/DUF47 family)